MSSIFIYFKKKFLFIILFLIFSSILFINYSDFFLRKTSEYLIQKELEKDVKIIHSKSFRMKDTLVLLEKNKEIFEIEGLYNEEKLRYYEAHNINGIYDYNIATQLLLSGYNDQTIEKLNTIYKNKSKIQKWYMTLKYALIKRLKSITFSSYNFEENWGNIAFQKAMCYNRNSEILNCLSTNNANACILSNFNNSAISNNIDVLKSIHYYKESLKNRPNDPVSRWLLNINYALLGYYPDSVPSQYLIDLEKFSTKETFSNKFTNISFQSKTNHKSYYGGVAVEDFNNDGFFDILSTSASLKDNVVLYTNKGNYNFIDDTKNADLLGITGGVNVIHGDYNNDGFEDIYLIRGGWMNKEGRKHPNSLLKNNGNGTFTDVTEQSGLLSFWSTHTAAWADINNDGFIDLFVGNERANAQLFINNTDGTFTEIAKSAKLHLNEYIKGATWLDYNNDGFYDLYISTYVGYNHLYKNLGTKSNSNIPVFKEVTKEAGVKEPFYSFPVVAFDFNNDGFTDILCADFKLSIRDFVNDYYIKKSDNVYPRLYINNRNGTFTDKWATYCDKRQTLSMGINVGDINNDGFLDIYLGTSYPDFAALVPNLMYMNLNGAGLADFTTQTGLGVLQKGHGIAFADLGNRGIQDIYANFGGWYSADVFQNALFKNNNDINNFIVLKLVGSISNKSAIGAKIKLTLLEKGHTRYIYRTISTGGSYGSSPLQAQIGLGNAQMIKCLEIIWSTNNKSISKFYNIPINKKIVITENQKEYKSINL